jgi:hypothetical protein
MARGAAEELRAEISHSHLGIGSATAHRLLDVSGFGAR